MAPFVAYSQFRIQQMAVLRVFYGRTAYESAFLWMNGIRNAVYGRLGVIRAMNYYQPRAKRDFNFHKPPRSLG